MELRLVMTVPAKMRLGNCEKCYACGPVNLMCRGNEDQTPTPFSYATSRINKDPGEVYINPKLLAMIMDAKMDKRCWKPLHMDTVREDTWKFPLPEAHKVRDQLMKKKITLREWYLLTNLSMYIRPYSLCYEDEYVPWPGETWPPSDDH